MNATDRENMEPFDWARSIPAAVTVCDAEGVILYMNDTSADELQKRGGRALIGCSIYDCHSPESGEMIRELLREEKSSVYSIEKGGEKKMIFQAPWYRAGKVAGILEITFKLPHSVPHFIRGENNL
jgi:hypothetical protein